MWAKQNHKPKKIQWYNKNRYAGYGRLIRRLTAGMSDHELQRIRGILARRGQEPLCILERMASWVMPMMRRTSRSSRPIIPE